MLVLWQSSIARKTLYFVSDDINTPLITSVEFKDHFIIVRGIEFSGEGLYGWCFAGSWGTIEEKIRQIIFLDESSYYFSI